MKIFNPDHEKSHEPRSRKKIKEILDSINDQEIRIHLEKWIYQYTSVCNDQLNNEPTAVAPFELNFNEQDANLYPDHEQSHEPRSRKRLKQS